jgi:hypothetical protein
MATTQVTGDELPAYASSQAPAGARAAPQRCSHSYSLENKGRTWITLKVSNSRAQVAKQLPLFYDGDTIEGAVEVDLDKAESAKAVTISASLVSLAVSACVDQARYYLPSSLEEVRAWDKMNSSS